MNCPYFLLKHANVHSAQELFEKSGFKIDGMEDFKEIPDEKWDSYIRSISQFENWQSMLSEATKEWVSKQLGF
jgi:predicted ester cyclase